MKRLFFKLSENKQILSTEEVLCEKDVIRGEIYLSTSNITWMVIDSNNKKVEAGEASSVELAKRIIKKVLLDCGAQFDREHRKYKI